MKTANLVFVKSVGEDLEHYTCLACGDELSRDSEIFVLSKKLSSGGSDKFLIDDMLNKEKSVMLCRGVVCAPLFKKKISEQVYSDMEVRVFVEV